MTGTVSIVAGQICVMFVLMAVGFVLYRRGFITDAGTAQMSDLVLYVANPVLIAQALMRPLEPSLLIGAGWVALLAAVTLAFSVGLGLIAYRGDVPHAAVGRFAVTFSNAGFIGIPLALVVAGQDCIFYISIANTVQTALVWTYGVRLVSGSRSEASPKKVLLNPAIVAMAIGLVCFFTSWEPPALVDTSLDALGNLNTGLVMLVLGAYLGKCRLSEVLTDIQLYKVAALRLVAMPLVAVGCLMALANMFVLDEAVRISVVMYQAMPVAAVTSLFANKYEVDAAFGTKTVAATTLLSLITLPLMMTLV